MPWKECHVMDERVRFISRLLDGEKMARLCAEFGISRKTGYKIYRRYKGCGVDGLTDRSRRPPAARQPAPRADRQAHRPAEAGIPDVGCADDPRAPAAAVRRKRHPSITATGAQTLQLCRVSPSRLFRARNGGTMPPLARRADRTDGAGRNPPGSGPPGSPRYPREVHEERTIVPLTVVFRRGAHGAGRWVRRLDPLGAVEASAAGCQ
jgi:hypothetical protein